MSNIAVKDIPGYAEAVNRESMLREAAFVSLPSEICSFAISVFTLQHYLILKLIGSPFLTGRTPSPNDLQATLWLLNPSYGSKQAGNAHVMRCRAFLPPSQPNSRNWLIQAIWRRQYKRRLELAAEITTKLREYIDDALIDFPAGSKKGYVTSYYGDGAWICGIFAHHFGWHDSQTLQTPMARLLQYLKVIADLQGSKVPKFNPSDLIVGRWISELNAKRN